MSSALYIIKIKDVRTGMKGARVFHAGRAYEHNEISAFV